MKDYIMNKIENHKKMVDSIDHESIGRIVNVIAECYRKGGKVLILGNGGSAADAMHIAAEFEGKLTSKDKRRALPALVPFNLSALTAISNDDSYDMSFQRFIEANGKPGDVIIAISTSGNSRNVLAAVEHGRNNGCKIVAMTGGNGGKLIGISDASFVTPASSTSTIQEGHIIAYHLICGLVIKELFGHDPL